MNLFDIAAVEIGQHFYWYLGDFQAICIPAKFKHISKRIQKKQKWNVQVIANETMSSSIKIQNLFCMMFGVFD
jgi:hypothetical protein